MEDKELQDRFHLYEKCEDDHVTVVTRVVIRTQALTANTNHCCVRCPASVFVQVVATVGDSCAV